MSTRGRLRVGTSGYDYDHWEGPLWPRDLPRGERFGVYARAFDTVEINSTFYGLPGASTFDAWRERAPRSFRYALKLSRYLTHRKKLRDPAGALRRFLERAEHLRAFLGPLLLQLPPGWHADPARLDAFLRAAPRRHRWAVELRDPDWLREEVFSVLRERGAALCLHDALAEHPRVLTAGWTYLRFHGTDDDHGGSYSPQKLGAVARWIRARLGEGVDVWAFFNNDAGGAAVRDARALRSHVRRHADEERGS